MKIIKLIQSEFIKNYTLKKIIGIILIVSLFSIGLVEFMNLFYFQKGQEIELIDNQMEIRNQELAQKENRTLEEDYELYLNRIKKEAYQYLTEKKITTLTDWHTSIVFDLRADLQENYLYKLIRDKIEDSFISGICSNENYKPTEYGDGYAATFVGTLSTDCAYYYDGTLEEKIEYLEKEIEAYEKLLKEDKFYLYLQYLIDTEQIFDDDIEIAQLIIDKKIENMWDARALNYIKYSFYQTESILSEEKFRKMQEFYHFPSYQDYVRFTKYNNEEAKKSKAILRYSIENNIENDLPSNNTHNYGIWSMMNSSYNVVTSKKMVNEVFHLTIIVLILVCITSSGIVSGEHSKGTIKNMITTPVKRYKILLSKFIYLILHTYIIWFIGLVALSIYSGIRFGFSDLFTPKLIDSGGKVIEVNYYLYLLKDMFFAGIPVIAFLSILFFLSTVTLNTAVTTSVMTILAIIPSILYYACAHLNLNFLVYTPLLYFDCGYLFDKQEFYIDILKKVDMNLGLGILVSLITIVILYTITNVVYIKRDIKN